MKDIEWYRQALETQTRSLDNAHRKRVEAEAKLERIRALDHWPEDGCMDEVVDYHELRAILDG